VGPTSHLCTCHFLGHSWRWPSIVVLVPAFHAVFEVLIRYVFREATRFGPPSRVTIYLPPPQLVMLTIFPFPPQDWRRAIFFKVFPPLCSASTRFTGSCEQRTPQMKNINFPFQGSAPRFLFTVSFLKGKIPATFAGWKEKGNTIPSPQEFLTFPSEVEGDFFREENVPWLKRKNNLRLAIVYRKNPDVSLFCCFLKSLIFALQSIGLLPERGLWC